MCVCGLLEGARERERIVAHRRNCGQRTARRCAFALDTKSNNRKGPKRWWGGGETIKLAGGDGLGVVMQKCRHSRLSLSVLEIQRRGVDRGGEALFAALTPACDDLISLSLSVLWQKGKFSASGRERERAAIVSPRCARRRSQRILGQTTSSSTLSAESLYKRRGGGRV